MLKIQPILPPGAESSWEEKGTSSLRAGGRLPDFVPSSRGVLASPHGGPCSCLGDVSVTSDCSRNILPCPGPRRVCYSRLPDCIWTWGDRQAGQSGSQSCHSSVACPSVLPCPAPQSTCEVQAPEHAGAERHTSSCSVVLMCHIHRGTQLLLGHPHLPSTRRLRAEGTELVPQLLEPHLSPW